MPLGRLSVQIEQAAQVFEANLVFLVPKERRLVLRGGIVAADSWRPEAKGALEPLVGRAGLLHEGDRELMASTSARGMLLAKIIDLCRIGPADH